MPAKQKQPERILNARPDTLDFRDKMYQASLYEVPVKVELDEYKSWNVPILDQGVEGACTGFGLATVANYLLRRRKIVPDPKPLVHVCFMKWPGVMMNGPEKIIADPVQGEP
jgi:hypothetical protein